MKKNGYVFRSEEFSLRCPQLEDSESLAKYCNDPFIHEAINTPYPYTVEMAEGYIRQTHEKWDEGITYNFGIEIDGEIGGMVSIMDINTDNLRGEVGYWLGEAFRGQSIMTKAVEAVINLGFTQLGLQKIFARTYPENKISAKVLLNAGLEKEGVLKSHALVNGVRKDYIYWGITP